MRVDAAVKQIEKRLEEQGSLLAFYSTHGKNHFHQDESVCADSTEVSIVMNATFSVAAMNSVLSLGPWSQRISIALMWRDSAANYRACVTPLAPSHKALFQILELGG